jgi:hypothetical protein
VKRINPFEMIRIRRKRRNGAGYFDKSGTFHPIRASMSSKRNMTAAEWYGSHKRRSKTRRRSKKRK